MKRLIDIPWDKKVAFIKRPNRFLGICQDKATNQEFKVHVRDPGRLKELLYPGNMVLIKKAEKKDRKTKWDLIAASSQKGEWVLVNSGFHSHIAQSIILDPDISPFRRVQGIEREVNVGGSRLDFCLVHNHGRKVFIEVKGCTLEKDGRALFPDAPTTRGNRHVLELLDLSRQGYGAAVMFLIFCPGVYCFAPNWETDPLFSKSLERATRQGVEVYPICLKYKDKSIWYNQKIDLCVD